MSVFDYKQEQALKDHVAWCVVERTPAHRYAPSLLGCIHQTQARLSFPPVYSVSIDQEKDALNFILSEFRKDLVQGFFTGEIPAIKDLVKISHESFFFMYLFVFLSSHKDDYDLAGIRVWEYGHSDLLTEFGVVYYKLFYLAWAVSVKSPVWKNDIAGWLSPNYFTSVIDPSL